MRTRAHQVDETLERIRSLRERRDSLERRLAGFEEMERTCAALVGILPGVTLEEIWRSIAKWYRDNLPLTICELARKCSREGATVAEAIDAFNAELNSGRNRWQQQLRSPTPTLPADLDDIKKIAFVLLRMETQSGKRPLLSRGHLYRILGPHFPKSLNCQTNLVSQEPSQCDKPMPHKWQRKSRHVL
jgi:hypothetical protein